MLPRLDRGTSVLPAANLSNSSRCRDLSRSRSSEVNHDARIDVGHGAGLAAGRRRPDSLGGRTREIPALRKQGRPRVSKSAIMALVTFASLSSALAEPGDASRGQQDFRACAPCHSLEPDRNMTGPSLANLWGRKAWSLPSFDRYSDALKSSGIIWDDRALDGWLTDPERMVPDNEMPFEGIK